MQYSSYCHSQHKYTNTNMILSIYISFNKAEAKTKAEAEGPRSLTPKGQHCHKKIMKAHVKSTYTAYAAIFISKFPFYDSYLLYAVQLM